MNWMKKMLNAKSINYILNRYFSIKVTRTYPKYSTRFVKELFGNSPIKVIEIGTYEGRNAQDILKNLNVDCIYLIDPYKEYVELDIHDNDWTYPQERLDKGKKLMQKRLMKYSNIVFIYEDSEKAFKQIKDKVEFVYIDGDHNYKFVKRDIEMYYEKLKHGGVMSGDDANAKGVSKAVIEFATEHDVVPMFQGREWYFRKPTKTSDIPINTRQEKAEIHIERQPDESSSEESVYRGEKLESPVGSYSK